MTARGRLAAVPDRPRRVVLYARVSALMGRSGDDFHSPTVQVGAMRRMTAGLTEVAVIEDLDATGRNFNRDGIARVRRMAELRQIDALAVYDVSRLGRNVRESLTFLAELAEMGVTILSACEQVDTSTPAGRLMLTNMLAIAEYRSDEIGRSWSATIARRADQGKHHGNPIGYTRRDGRLTPDPIVGPAITRAWLDYAAGVPVAQIMKDISAARGKAVYAGNTKTMFRRPVYLGHVVADGEVIVKDAHPALVDEDTWDLVQLRLARDSKTPPRALAITWAMVGLCLCASCGARLQRNPRTRRGVLENRLICGKSRTKGVVNGCDGIGYPLMDLVEAEVLARAAGWIRELRTDDGARAEHLVRRNAALADGRALRRRLTVVQDGIAKLAKAWALGDLQEDEFRPASGELRAERDALQARLAELGDVAARRTPEEAASAAEALLTLWPDMLVSERNRALKALIEKVQVRRSVRWREPEAERVTITWR
jgi:site-specific DNA recombinase